MKKTKVRLITCIIFCLCSITLLTGCGNKNEWTQIPSSRQVKIIYGADSAVYQTNTYNFDVFYYEEGTSLLVEQYTKGGKKKDSLILIAKFDAPYILDYSNSY